MCKSIYKKFSNVFGVIRHQILLFLYKFDHNMCKSIYQRIADDFKFIKDYGFCLDHIFQHYVQPSVTYKKDLFQIQIGFSYEEDKFFINEYDLSLEQYYAYAKSKHLLENIILIGASYKEQVEQVKKILREYLDTNFQSIN